MKRSEIESRINQIISAYGTNPEYAAKYLLDTILEMGMLPPEYQLANPEHFDIGLVNEWEPENE